MGGKNKKTNKKRKIHTNTTYTHTYTHTGAYIYFSGINLVAEAGVREIETIWLNRVFSFASKSEKSGQLSMLKKKNK